MSQAAPARQGQPENKMGVMPVPKLLFTMALPMMISMLVQALYNIVDSIFLSRVSEEALTALSLAFPVQNLMIAVGSGTGVGMNALLSRSLGEKNYSRANRAAMTGLTLVFLCASVFFLFGLFGTGLFFRLQTEDAAIIGYGVDYLSIISMGAFFLLGQIMFERLLQSTGKTVYSMIAQATGTVTNIILDPILIFGWLGLPAMGATGAAVATVIGQFLSCLVGLYLNLTRNKELTLKLKGFRLEGRMVGRIYKVGLPSIVMMSIGSVMTLGMNNILMGFASTATAVFGVYFKLQSFAIMPVVGMNNAMVPIIAYNLGARNKKRIMDTIKVALLTSTSFLTFVMILFQIFPEQVFSLFEASEDMLAMGIPALRIITLHFTMAGFGVIAGSIFQALGNGMLSLFASAIRQLAVLLPSAYLLSLTGNVNNVWWSFVIAEFACVTFCAWCMKKLYKTVIKPLDEPLPEKE